MNKNRNSLKKSLVRSYTSIFLIFILTIFILLFLIFRGATNVLNELGEAALKNKINMAVEYLDFLESQVNKGYIDREQAQETFRTSMLNKVQKDGKTRGLNNKLELGIEAYMYAIDKNGKEMMHPFKEGENISNIVDDNGKNVVQLILNEGNNPKNDGIITFFWKNPNENKTREKVNAVKYYEPWGWYLNVGTYYEDFYGNIQQLFFNILLIVFIIIIIIYIFILFKIDKKAKPFTKLVNTIEKLSNGDLKVEFDYNRNDEIKIVADSLKILKKKIKDYIELSNRSSEILLESSEELNGASDYISKSSIQISDTINNLAYDTTKQLEHSEKANKNMEILDNLIYECKEKMIIVSENSNEAVKSVSQGLKVIKDLISSTDESKVSNEEIFKAITQATDKAKNVEKVSSVISSIAAQTRLLALNATIEASKAGEFGRGFSVVADEIRTLADEAQKSSKEIENVVKELIENVEKMNEIRVNVEDNNKKQSDSINETENKYKNIYESIKNSEKSIRSYGDLVEELLNKKQEVIEDIDSLASISKNNSAKTQEINASVEEQTSSIESVEEYSQKLLELSKELKNSIDKYFKL